MYLKSYSTQILVKKLKYGGKTNSRELGVAGDRSKSFKMLSINDDIKLL